MRTVDRINAVIRTKQYETAFKRCKPQIFDGLVIMEESASQKLCKSFGLPFPYAPNSNIKNVPPVLPISRAGSKKNSTVIGPDESLWMPVKIDMTQKIGPILDEIKRIHNAFKVRKHPDFDKTRDKGSSLDIWKVRDMVALHNMDYYEVAKKFGMQSKPTDDWESDRIYQQVKEADSKAEEMIEKVQRGEL